MKWKFISVLAILLGLLAGCTVDPEESPTASAGETPSAVSGTLNVYCFQAGKADAFLLWNESGAVLIDTGESGFGKTICKKLSKLGIERLDYLIITHFDKDHVGGAKKLLTEIPVGTVLQSNAPKEGSTPYEKYVSALASLGMEAVTLRQSMRFTLGDVSFTVDPPQRESYQVNESNNSSLIVAVTHGEDRLLFTGDAEDERMTEYLRQETGSFDFVKLPHHGVYQSTLETLLEQTRPACALITSSDEEPEDAETLALLESCGVEVYLTRTAPVQLTSTGKGLQVSYIQ